MIVPAPTTDLTGFWGYVALLLTSYVTEEAAPVVGGFAAQRHELGLVRVAVTCAIGSWGAGVGLYYIGRWRGYWVRRRWPKLRKALTRALVIVRRRPWQSSFAVRFAYGFRLTLPLACGAARLPLGVYLIGSAISAATWSSLFTLLGWMFGQTALAVLRHVQRYDDVIALAVLGGIGIGIYAIFRRAEVAEEVAGEQAEVPKTSLTDSGVGPAIRPEGERRKGDRRRG